MKTLRELIDEVEKDFEFQWLRRSGFPQKCWEAMGSRRAKIKERFLYKTSQWDLCVKGNTPEEAIENLILKLKNNN